MNNNRSANSVHFMRGDSESHKKNFLLALVSRIVQVVYIRVALEGEKNFGC